MKEILRDVYYVGCNDHKVDLFEGMYHVPNGVSYNSYVLKDEKIAVFDTVDEDFGQEWLNNIESVLGGQNPDYLIVQHMEPDHSANILAFVKKYPNVTVVGNNKTFIMMVEYFGDVFPNRLVVVEGQELCLGSHTLKFIFAPMVHWPEVMMTYDMTDKIFYSADAFGKFGALDVDEPWEDEARRYYIGIVGKYGVQVQGLFKKVAGLEIKAICPLHGPILNNNLGYYLDLYTKWATYTSEVDGVMLAYTSVYGHTKTAVIQLAEMLQQKGVNVAVFDLAREDRAKCVAEAFKYSKIVLATTTYNAEIFPTMREFIDCLVERNFQNKKVAFIENGTWAPVVAKQMQAKFEKCKNLEYASTVVKIRSAISKESEAQLIQLANEMM